MSRRGSSKRAKRARSEAQPSEAGWPRLCRGRDHSLALALGFAVACAMSGAFALRQLDRPGLNYDEAIQAVPAAVFLTRAAPSPIPGQQSTRLLGRWFPLLTQPYMGALKSQALIPTFALFGASPTTLRASTWLWTMLGVLFSMLFARELFGTPAALLCGALLALDPGVLFVGRHDWGSFALGFALRAAALALFCVGWRRQSAWRFGLAGLCLGLGLYNKLDFGIFLLAAGIALSWAAPRLPLGALRERPRILLLACAGFALGAAPMLASLPGALRVGRALGARAGAGALEWSEKLVAFRTTLDGSYFQRLMLCGGRFESLGDVEGAAASAFGLLFAAAALLLLLRARHYPAHRFVLAAALLTLLGVFLTPRAVRIHHVLNATPFPQLVVAAALAMLWRLGSGRPLLRGLALAAAALALAGSARVDARTLATIAETGGKGRWSDALGGFAAALPPGSVAVTLDWGFAEPLRLLAPGLPVLEATWSLRGERPQLQLDGTPDHVYLLPPERYAVFGHGQTFLEALRALPEGTAAIESVADRSGEPAFLAVRIARPHRLEYRRGLLLRLR